MIVLARFLTKKTSEESIIRNQSKTRRGRKSSLRAASVYGAVFALIVSFLAINNHHQSTGVVDATQAAQVSNETQQSVQSQEKLSTDQLAVANAVVNLAEATDLPSAGDLREATTTLQIKKELTQEDVEVISKPQIIKPETSSQQGIAEYTAGEGESIVTIAEKYGISAQTLRWANGMVTDVVEPGKTLVVPQTDGVVYTVKEGDTVQALAEKYKVDQERIVLYNNLDANGALAKDTKIVLPSGELPETERPGYVAPRANTSSYAGFSYANVRASVGNRYAGGNCTWYSYERRMALGRPIGSFWGDAKTWATSARAAGFVVNGTPAPGAIFQTAAGGGGYGHVGIVERVEGGRVFVSDMNYAGLGIVTHRELLDPYLYNYIH